MMEDNQQYTLGGFGTRLKTARETLHYSQKDVAMRLHLSPNIIQIIESEDLRNAPPSTFMRGYLRSYAKLLNVDDEEINQALAHSGLDLPPKTSVAPVLLQGDSFLRSDRYVHWVTMLVLAISLVLVSIWWNSHSHEAATYTTHNGILNSSVPSSTPHVEVVQQPASIPGQMAAPTAPSTVQSTVATTNTTPPSTPLPPPTSPEVGANNPAAPITNSTVPSAVPQPNPASTPPMMAGAQPAPTTTNAAPAAPIAPTTPGIVPPLAAAAPAQQNVTQSVNSEPHRKHRRHLQDNHVSGMAMALPEPGLE